MNRRICLLAVSALVAGPAVIAGPAARAEEPAKPAKASEGRKMTDAERKALQKKMLAAVNAGAGQIDACVARYTKEYPANKGQVTLALEIARKGKVLSAKASTGLKGARNLRPCIEAAGKKMAFPAPNTVKPARLTLTVPVYKGAKYKAYGPGEAPKPKAGEPAPPVAVQFTGNSWVPRW